MIPTGNSRFRFENMWLRESIRRDIMIESWESTQGQDLMTRIGRCGKAIWDWGKNFTKNFNRRIQYWRNRMEKLKHRRDHQGLSEFREAQHQYLRALHHQNDYWRQRAKIFWLKEGDINSSFFHNSVRRRKQNNRISGLKDDRGAWVERGISLDSLVLNYFNNIFQPTSGNVDSVIECIEPKINTTDNVMLNRRISLQEVKEALFDMKPDKSPGPDGLNLGFFIHFWDVLNPELLRFVSVCFQTGTIPKGINSTHVVLIPKKAKPENMGT